ncbi:MAG: DUF4124 domain-containing protein [Gammaproteobacteria bacterium]|nr:DUF4124 domain-containing protein [Gammaproteobacteria bacterium]MBV8973782.1 DUF4124 domain-containing protein [Nevskiaceae bacterium]MBV9318229.1 DUF4124 domain-containing protein [Gammaproteobacteria bacterium]MBV9726130.1 DUF4124 domain-containing protein [Gammaproteobacteria bacterium]
MLRRLLVSALILAGAFTMARADVYRWVDDRGQPHYSDQWMPGSEVIKTSKAHPAGADGAARTADQRSLTASNNRVAAKLGDEDNARAVQQDVASRHAVLCKQSRDNYMKAITSRRVYKEGTDGARDYLSDADADAYREQLRKQVQEYCGSVPQFDPNAPIAQPQPVEPKPIPEPKVNPAAATSR